MGYRQSKRETDSEQLGLRKRMTARERVREPWLVRRSLGGEAEGLRAGRETGRGPKRAGRGGWQPHVITVSGSAPLCRVGGRQK